MVNLAQIQHETPPLTYWHAALEWCDGAMEFNALSDAPDLF